ncbi:MAG TPA: hypothetical protein VF815_25040 [Myxococcaceae bacterium]
MLSGPKRGRVQRESKPCHLGNPAVPTDKAGRVKQGDLLILGDGNGIVAITSGTPEMWTTNGIYREQRPMVLTPDGSRVLVTAGDSSLHEFWSWSFAPRPGGIRVLAPGISDSAGTQVISGRSAPPCDRCAAGC